MWKCVCELFSTCTAMEKVEQEQKNKFIAFVAKFPFFKKYLLYFI